MAAGTRSAYGARPRQDQQPAAAERQFDAAGVWAGAAAEQAGGVPAAAVEIPADDDFASAQPDAQAHRVRVDAATVLRLEVAHDGHLYRLHWTRTGVGAERHAWRGAALLSGAIFDKCAAAPDRSTAPSASAPPRYFASLRIAGYAGLCRAFLNLS